MFPQQASAEILHGEDHCHIEEAALQTADMQFCKKPLERRQQAGGTIDGEHPQGSIAGEAQIPTSQRMQSSEQNFHTPAAQSAQDKVFTEGFKKIFHGLSICAFRHMIQERER